MNQATAQIAERGEGRCALSGALTLETAAWLWKQLRDRGLLASTSEADLSGLTHSDSAGLALLVAWRAAAAKSGNNLGFTGVPERLRALAAITGAGALLQA